MPALKNPKHERFAQELAKGSGVTEAYVAAGYGESPASATRLSKTVKVAARVDELKARAAERAVISIASVTERLLKIAAKGEKSEDAPLLGVARQSLMDAAKLNGLIVDKSLTAATSVEDLLDRLDAG